MKDNFKIIPRIFSFQNTVQGLGLIVLLFWLYCGVFRENKGSFPSILNKENIYTQNKTILFYNGLPMGSWEDRMGWLECNHGAKCFLTTDQNYHKNIRQWDAIIYDYHRGKVPLITNRSPHQIYIALLRECPHHMLESWGKYNNYFNWTFTYLVEHDVPMDYGRIYLKSMLHNLDWYPEDHLPWMEYNRQDFMKSLPSRSSEFHALAQRPYLAAFLISNCGGTSQRRNYIDELSRHIQIDGYGKCGQYRCDNGTRIARKKLDLCYAGLHLQYKFFLAFENSICKEYVTEKFFQNMDKGMVPIVLSGSNHSLLAPPHSYIDTGDFSSPKELAEYLQFLHENPSEYLSYFWWQDDYRIVNQAPNKLCVMCEKLYEDDGKPHHKVYHNFPEYWSNSSCRESGQHPWSNFPLKLEHYID